MSAVLRAARYCRTSSSIPSKYSGVSAGLAKARQPIATELMRAERLPNCAAVSSLVADPAITPSTYSAKKLELRTMATWCHWLSLIAALELLTP